MRAWDNTLVVLSAGTKALYYNHFSRSSFIFWLMMIEPNVRLNVFSFRSSIPLLDGCQVNRTLNQISNRKWKSFSSRLATRYNKYTREQEKTANGKRSNFITDRAKIETLFGHSRLAHHHSVAFTPYQILFHIIIHWNFVCSLTANKTVQPNIIFFASTVR